jgi:hypothetical protein
MAAAGQRGSCAGRTLDLSEQDPIAIMPGTVLEQHAPRAPVEVDTLLRELSPAHDGRRRARSSGSRDAGEGQGVERWDRHRCRGEVMR